MILNLLMGLFAPDDPSLIRSALAGRSGATRTLIRRLMPVIRAQAWAARRRRGLPFEGIDDDVQEVWLELFEAGGRRLLAYDPQRGATLEGYVGILAERALGGLRRKAAALKRGGDLKPVDAAVLDRLPAEHANPEQTVAARVSGEGLLNHLDAQLPERGRLIFRYLYMDERSPAQTAQALGVKLQVVYNWQHRIRKESRLFFGEN